MRLAALFDRGGRTTEVQLAHALRSVPLFRQLPTNDLVTLWRRVNREQVPAGTVLFERGEPGDRFYIVQAGAVDVCLGLDERRMVLRRLGPGDCFGEMALVTGAPRTADVVATEETVLWVIERQGFEELMATRIPVLQALISDLCSRLSLITLQIDELQARLGEAGPGAPSGLRFGSYQVVAPLGSGGMAVVFSAMHVEDGTAAAIKVLPAAWGEAVELRARLEHEAAVLQTLAHQNIVRVLEVGRVRARDGGGCYLAMEWLPNALDRMLRAQYPKPLAVPVALHLAHCIAEALTAVHEAKLVHRDVKPSNILLRADGTPVLADFGTVLEHGGLGRRLTVPGVVMGTADYMAPEQYAGEPVDARSDLYALGVVLYEMVAGHVPFAGRDPLDTLRAHVEEAPPPLPPEVPPPVRAIVERALQKRPEDRFPSAAAMAAALAEARAAARSG